MTATDELPPLPDPFDYCYEWDGPYGTRKFSAASHNGMKPTRSVPLFNAEKMRDYATAARAPLLAELDALRERAESAERDAQRYRAFFDSGPSVCFMGRDYTNRAECDAAIDAAIKGSAA